MPTALCDNDHYYHTNTGCYGCRAMERKREARERERELYEEQIANEKYHKYINSQEYFDKCHKERMRREQTIKNIKLVINWIINIIYLITNYFVKLIPDGVKNSINNNVEYYINIFKNVIYYCSIIISKIFASIAIIITMIQCLMLLYAVSLLIKTEK